MPEAAQTNGARPFKGSSLRSLPVLRCAIGTKQHLFRLIAKIVNPTGLICPPTGVVVIASGHCLSFGLLFEREPFIPAAGEFKKEAERMAHGLEPLIRPGNK